MNGDGQNIDIIGNVDGQNISPATVTTGTLTATNINATNIDTDDIATFTLEVTNLSQLGDVEASGLITAQDIDVVNNISALGFSATNGLFEELRFIEGGQAPSILAPYNYKFPTTPPPNDSTVYAMCNQPNLSTITTPNTFPNFKLILTEGLDTVTIVVTFIFNTVVDSSFVYSRINDNIDKWFSLQNSPSYVSLSLDVSSFPYRTNVNVTSPACTAQILFDISTGMAPLLGYTATSPIYGVGSTPSPNTNSFSLIPPNAGQLTWSSLNGVGSSTSSVPFEVQSPDGLTSVVCEDDSVNINVENVTRLIADDTNSAFYSKSFPATGGSGITFRDDGFIEIATYNGLLGSFNVFPADPKVNITSPGGLGQIDMFANITNFTNDSGGFPSVRQSINPVSEIFRSPDSATQMTIDNTGIRTKSYYLPSDVGTSGQVITSDGLGVSSWVTPIMCGLFSQTSSVTVANTAVDTNMNGAGVGSLVIPANFLTQGVSLLYKSGGVFRSSANNQTFRFRYRMNALTILDTGLLTLGNVNTSRSWNIETQITYYTNTIQTNFRFGYNDGTSIQSGFYSQASGVAFDPTISNTLQASLQWTTANINNTLTTNYSTLTKIY